MYFAPETLAVNRNMQGHWNQLWSQRNIYNMHNDLMVNQYRPAMDATTLACNALGGFATEFWKEIDRNVLELRDQETGMEIVQDLPSIVLPVGKTVKMYSAVGDIAKDVSVSIDGQAPYSFDHTEYASDGDPIPMFSAGYGVNWRLAQGLNTVGIDLVLDSQRAKMREFNKKLVSYTLNGDSRIVVDGKAGQGLKNHRNTKKIDLTVANIDLTTASMADLIAFFGTGAFGQNRIANKVTAYDVMWVSPQIMANLNQPYVSTGGVVSQATVGATIQRYTGVKEFRETFALNGNEFLAYVKRSDLVATLDGMTTGITPLPRPLPQTNYNFQILAAMGIQVTADADGLSGVVYGAELT